MKIHKSLFIQSLTTSFLLLVVLGANANSRSMDPVELNEATLAQSLAGMPPGLARRRSVASDTGPNLEFLDVQTHRFEKGSGRGPKRWVDVTAYDYSTDELVITVVNLNSNKVMSSKRYRNMQPPISQNELKRAMDIVFNDPEERQLLDKEFLEITGQTLTSIDQLDHQAFTFFAQSMPHLVNAASESCGKQRCARLMLTPHKNVVFSFTPIVNLSEGLVTQRLGL